MDKSYHHLADLLPNVLETMHALAGEESLRRHSELMRSAEPYGRARRKGLAFGRITANYPAPSSSPARL